MPFSLLQPSTSSQALAEQHEEPDEHKYEYINKTSVVPPKNGAYDYAAFDGLGGNNRKTTVELDRIEDEDYVIKIDAGETKAVATHYEDVVSDATYDKVRPQAKVETHYDYVLHDEFRDTMTRPEGKVETHYDYVIRHELKDTMTRPEDKVETPYDCVVRHDLKDTMTRPEAKMKTHYDHVVRDKLYNKFTISDAKKVETHEDYAGNAVRQPGAKAVETHYDRVVRYELKGTMIRPEAKVETHYDHVVRDDDKLITARAKVETHEVRTDDKVIEPKSEQTKEVKTHDDNVARYQSKIAQVG